MRDIKIKQRRGYLEIAPKVVSEYASYKDLSKPSLFSDNQTKRIFPCNLMELKKRNKREEAGIYKQTTESPGYNKTSDMRQSRRLVNPICDSKEKIMHCSPMSGVSATPPKKLYSPSFSDPKTISPLSYSKSGKETLNVEQSHNVNLWFKPYYNQDSHLSELKIEKLLPDLCKDEKNWGNGEEGRNNLSCVPRISTIGNKLAARSNRVERRGGLRRSIDGGNMKRLKMRWGRNTEGTSPLNEEQAFSYNTYNSPLSKREPNSNKTFEAKGTSSEVYAEPWEDRDVIKDSLSKRRVSRYNLEDTVKYSIQNSIVGTRCSFDRVDLLDRLEREKEIEQVEKDKLIYQQKVFKVGNNRNCVKLYQNTSNPDNTYIDRLLKSDDRMEIMQKSLKEKSPILRQYRSPPRSPMRSPVRSVHSSSSDGDEAEMSPIASPSHTTRLTSLNNTQNSPFDLSNINEYSVKEKVDNSVTQLKKYINRKFEKKKYKIDLQFYKMVKSQIPGNKHDFTHKGTLGDKMMFIQRLSEMQGDGGGRKGGALGRVYERGLVGKYKNRLSDNNQNLPRLKPIKIGL